MIYSLERLIAAAKTEKGKKIIDNAEITYGSLYANKPIVLPGYEKFKLYLTEGDRDKYECEYFDLRNRLILLQLLAVREDAYFDALEEVLAAICDQFTWIVPAHNYKKDGKSFDYTQIDLFCAETANWLSETIYVFKDKLSYDIVDRVKKRLEEIINIFESKSFFWESCGNNWASVCGGSIGLTYLYVFPERFEGVEKRILDCVDCYLNVIGEDGMCPEGVDYWEYGFSNFCNFYSSYIAIKGKEPKILKTEKVLKTIKYIDMARLSGDIFLPFADGGQRRHKLSIGYCSIIKSLFPEAFEMPVIDTERYLLLDESNATRYKKGMHSGVQGLNGRANGLKALFGLAYYEQVELGQKIGNSFYENAEIFVSRTEDFAFVAKCGTNHEAHNHNDVGAFQLIVNEERIIADLGAGQYNYNYFNKPNYEYDGRYGEQIFVCGSKAHSVPIVNGGEQRYGLKYEGKVLEASNNSIKMDLSGAYEEAIERLIATYTTSQRGVTVEYSAKGFKSIAFRFITEIEPKVKDELVDIDCVSIGCSGGSAKIQIAAHKYLDHFGFEQTAYSIDYVYDDVDAVDVKFALVVNK